VPGASALAENATLSMTGNPIESSRTSRMRSGDTIPTNVRTGRAAVNTVTGYTPLVVRTWTVTFSPSGKMVMTSPPIA
jgi:hypothetical protein